MYSLLSQSLSDVSIVLERTKIVNIYLLLEGSIQILSAEKNPATGAFTESFLLPHLLITQSISLYRVLKHIRKRPNLVQSTKLLAWLRFSISLDGLAMRPTFFINNYSPKPSMKFFNAALTTFSKHPN